MEKTLFVCPKCNHAHVEVYFTTNDEGYITHIICDNCKERTEVYDDGLSPNSIIISEDDDKNIHITIGNNVKIDSKLIKDIFYNIVD